MGEKEIREGLRLLARSLDLDSPKSQVGTLYDIDMLGPAEVGTLIDYLESEEE